MRLVRLQSLTWKNEKLLEGRLGRVFALLAAISQVIGGLVQLSAEQWHQLVMPSMPQVGWETRLTGPAAIQPCYTVHSKFELHV